MNESAEISWKQDGENAITVSMAGTEILSYTYDATDDQKESPRPFFHPIRTLDGETVSIFRPHDHTWHKGLAWSLPNFGDNNFWGGPTFKRNAGYQWLPINGSMEHLKTTESEITDGSFRFSHDLAWRTQAGEHQVNENRTISVQPGKTGDSWILVFETEMTNVSGHNIQIGSPTTEGRDNAGYGGLFWRGPRSFTGGRIIGPGEASGEELRGRRSPWLGFIGQHDETSHFSTIVMVDAETNAQHPPEWFARSEPFGCLGPAPFFSKEVTFHAGETIVNRYAVIIADGDSDSTRASLLAASGQSALKHHAVAAETR